MGMCRNSMAVGHVFKCFGLQNKWRQPHMLDDAHNQTSRNSRQNYSEQNPRDHDVSIRSVAGKADGVAGVVGGVVQAAIAGEAGAVDQK